MIGADMAGRGHRLARQARVGIALELDRSWLRTANFSCTARSASCTCTPQDGDEIAGPLAAHHDIAPESQRRRQPLEIVGAWSKGLQPECRRQVMGFAVS